MLDLLQLRGDGVEFRVKSGADRVDGGDNHNRNAGSDQAVFNRSGASTRFSEKR